MNSPAYNQATNLSDAPQVLRDVAEKTAAQAKDNLEKMSVAASEATSMMKNASTTAFKGAQEYSAKVMEFTQANINSAVAHFTKLSTVKTPAEFFALSSEHARQQFEVLSRQAQELASIGQKMATTATEAIKTGVRKGV